MKNQYFSCFLCSHKRDWINWVFACLIQDETPLWQCLEATSQILWSVRSKKGRCFVVLGTTGILKDFKGQHAKTLTMKISICLQAILLRTDLTSLIYQMSLQRGISKIFHVVPFWAILKKQLIWQWFERLYLCGFVSLWFVCSDFCCRSQ